MESKRIWNPELLRTLDERLEQISTSAQNALFEAKIHYAGQLIQMTSEVLRRVRGLKPTDIDSIEAGLLDGSRFMVLMVMTPPYSHTRPDSTMMTSIRTSPRL